jgi:hypothetical protein
MGALLLAALAGCSKSPPPAPAAGADNGGSPAREIALRPEQVRFDHTGIASDVRVERRPATRMPARPGAGTQATPAHLLIILDPATLPDPAVPETRALIVYPAADWSKTYARLHRPAEDPVPALRKLLDDETPEMRIEFPPAAGHAGARQILRSAVRYLRFQGGHGVRFLTVYQGDPLPISDRDFVYVFQGLTTDGRYWVTLNLPVTVRGLPPPDAAVAQLADYDRFVADHERYLADIVHKLRDARSEDFTPRLERIDAMLESLAID